MNRRVFALAFLFLAQACGTLICSCAESETTNGSLPVKNYEYVLAVRRSFTRIWDELLVVVAERKRDKRGHH